MYGATLSPVYDWLSALGAPAVRLQPSSAEAHDVALTTRMVWQAAKCRLIFGIGLGMESYLNALQAALGKRCPPIERLGEQLQVDDPHIWFDTRHARTCLQRMTEILCRDVDSSSLKKGGKQAYSLHLLRQSQQKLDALDTLIKRIARKHQGKYYIAQHDAFRLLTRRVGLNSLGSFQPDHERPPSLSHLLRLIKRARTLPVLCVIGSEESDVGKNLAHQLRIPYLTLDTLEHPHPKHDYFERMKATLEVFEDL